MSDVPAVPLKDIMDGKPSGPKKPFNVSYPGSNWNKITNAKGGLPVGRAAYNLHIANLKVAKKIRNRHPDTRSRGLDDDRPPREGR